MTSGLPEPAKSVLLLCSDNPASRMIFHYLCDRSYDVVVVEEDRVPQWQLLRRRAARLGLPRVAGQLLFRSLVVPWLTVRDRGRVAQIKREHGLDDGPIEPVLKVPSMNDERTQALLRDMRPAISIVCGTRILNDATLGSLNGPVVNFHFGITPLYRGVHGGYWALVEGRRDLVGSTIHVVDSGIDTGKVLSQVTFEVADADSFVTYPYLHVAAALEPLEDLVRRAIAGEELVTQPVRTDLGSKLRTHPTLSEYVRHARAGVR